MNDWRFIHGMCHTPEYQSWASMKARCLRPTEIGYSRYGGRGISICPEWIDSFKAFYDYIGPRPSPKHSLDRIDNNGNYEPGNVRWATRKQQANNTRTVRTITINGVTKPTTEWEELAGLRLGTIRQRQSRGWSGEELLQPVKTYWSRMPAVREPK